MSSKKLIIYEYDTLFNILNEIKEYCNFEIVKADKKNQTYFWKLAFHERNIVLEPEKISSF